MNTAARMESSGQSNCIQMSQITADLLIKDGWIDSITPRKSKIVVKGKGDMQTYWLRGKQKVEKSVTSMSTAPTEVLEDPEREDTSGSDSLETAEHINRDHGDDLTKSQRLVEWSVEVLSSLLQQIIASRDASKIDEVDVARTEAQLESGDTVLEEFVPSCH